MQHAHDTTGSAQRALPRPHRRACYTASHLQFYLSAVRATESAGEDRPRDASILVGWLCACLCGYLRVGLEVQYAPGGRNGEAEDPEDVLG